jgi:hypothetical protein
VLRVTLTIGCWLQLIDSQERRIKIEDEFESGIKPQYLHHRGLFRGIQHGLV